MTSQDVIHSFFVPAFRIKQDVLPGRYTVAWFRATKPGVVSSVLRGVLRHPALRHGRLDRRAGAGSVRSLDERRVDRSALRDRREDLSPNSGASPVTAPTRRDAAPICREFSASRCNLRMAAPSPPTRTTSASASSTPARSESKDSSPSCPRSRGWSAKNK